MEPVLSFQDNSETIRQLPENYLIAYRSNGRWICEPDLAANKELAIRVFLALFDHDTKYGDGLNLLSKVTPNGDFTKVVCSECGSDDVVIECNNCGTIEHQ
jgi:hypothetical protein